MCIRDSLCHVRSALRLRRMSLSLHTGSCKASPTHTSENRFLPNESVFESPVPLLKNIYPAIFSHPKKVLSLSPHFPGSNLEQHFSVLQTPVRSVRSHPLSAISCQAAIYNCFCIPSIFPLILKLSVPGNSFLPKFRKIRRIL